MGLDTHGQLRNGHGSDVDEILRGEEGDIYLGRFRANHSTDLVANQFTQVILAEKGWSLRDYQ